MQTRKLTPHQRRELNNFIGNSSVSGPAVRRAQAVLLLDQGAVDTAQALTNFGREHVFRLRRQYLTAGLKSFDDKRQGNPRRLLTAKQRAEVMLLLTTKTPPEVSGAYASQHTWTPGILGRWIERRYRVAYKSKTSHSLLFKEAKFTYHKPGRVYQKRDDTEVRRWRTRAKKRLMKAWPDPKTAILTGDEMVLLTQTTFQKIWLPEGEYPRIEVSNNRQNRSVYGFLDVKTGQEHAWKTRRQNMHETVQVLKKLRKRYPKKKILLLWDSARWHVGSKVTEWMKRDGNVETVPFPKYSPEENPQEHVWRAGRSQVTHNRFIENIDEATDDFVRYLNRTSFPYTLLGRSGIS